MDAAPFVKVTGQAISPSLLAYVAGGQDTRDYYNVLGETTETINDYTNGTPTTSSNQTTAYTHDGDGNLTSVTATDTTGGSPTTQETAYIYQARVSTGSEINSNDIMTAEEYANPSTGEASSASEDLYTVNALGQDVTYTDRDLTTLTYGYDVLGRVVSDTVTAWGTGIDESITQIDTAYNAAGEAYKFTSMNGSTIVNQVVDTFNGLGQLTEEQQAVSGAVTASTPYVEYGYSTPGSGSNLTSLTYPSGRILYYNYTSSYVSTEQSSLDSSISRLASISDSSGTLEAFTYLGDDTVVDRAFPQTGFAQSLIGGSAGPRRPLHRPRSIRPDRGGSLLRCGDGCLRRQFPVWLRPVQQRHFGDQCPGHGLQYGYTYNGLNELTGYTKERCEPTLQPGRQRQHLGGDHRWHAGNEDHQRAEPNNGGFGLHFADV